MANCNIIRDGNNEVLYVEAPNGSRSILYDNLSNKVKDATEALNLWLVSKTKDFKDAVMYPIKTKDIKVVEKVVSPIKMKGVSLHYEDNVNPFTLEKTGDIELRLVKVDTESRGQGLAKQAITKFLQYTDTAGKPTYLIISPRETNITKEGLIKLYKSFGFELLETGFEMRRPAGKTKLPTVLEGLDENGEPNMGLVLGYVDVLSEPDINEEQDNIVLKDIMIGLNVSSSFVLQSKLKQGFMPEGYFNPTRDSLEDSGLYNSVEITDILTNSELQENIKSFIYKLSAVDSDVLNDVYTDNKYLVIEDGGKNEIGKFKLANPYIIEKRAVESLGGVKTREEFESKLFEDELSTFLATPYLEALDTKDDLYPKFKAFKSVAIVGIEEGQLTTKLSNTREYMEETLLTPKDNELFNSLDFLINLDAQFYEQTKSPVNTLIKDVSKAMIEIGLDTTNLEEKRLEKSVDDLKGFFTAVASFIETTSPQAFDNLVGTYNEFFDINEDFKYKNIIMPYGLKESNVFYLETKAIDTTLFVKHGLIPIGKNIYKRVTMESSVEGLYEAIYQKTMSKGYTNVLSDEAVRPTGFDSNGTLNLNKVLDPANKEAIIRDMKAHIKTLINDIFVEDLDISQESLERYALLFNFYNKSSNFSKFHIKPEIRGEYSIFINEINNKEYLQTKFIADFNKKALKEKYNDSTAWKEFYKNFEINTVGIKLVNTDPITMNLIKNYLPNNKDLVNYLRLHKQGIDLDTLGLELPIYDDLFFRNYYSNFPTALKDYRGNRSQLSENNILAKSKDAFIRINNGVYELLRGLGRESIYGKIPSNRGIFKEYSTAMTPPTIDIDTSELMHIDANINTETNITNIYTEEELREINNKNDNC